MLKFLARWMGRRYTGKLASQGMLDDAVRLQIAAIKAGDTSEKARRDLAGLYLKQSAYAQALPQLLAAERAGATDDVLRTQLAFCYEMTGKLEQAFERWDQLHQKNRDQESLLHKALVAQRLGRNELAINLYGQLLEADPADQLVIRHLGRVLLANKQVDEAKQCFERLLEETPQDAELLCLLGECHGTMQDEVQAESCFLRAIEADPELVMPLMVLATVYIGRNDPETASTYLLRAAALSPDQPEIWDNIGSNLLQLGRVSQGLEAMERALALSPDNVTRAINLSAANAIAGMQAEAEGHLRRAMLVAPKSAEVHFNLGLILLNTGQYKEGFSRYEARRTLVDCLYINESLHEPEWQGEPLAGKTIRLVVEQGFGDNIQMVRFAGDLHQQGARVIVEASPPLRRLLGCALGVEAGVDGRDETIQADFALPMMSLPYRLGLEIKDLPGAIPYFKLATQDVDRWQSHLSGARKLRIGIAWQSDLDNWIAVLKSVELAALAPVLASPDVSLVNLQFGPGAVDFRRLFPDEQHLDLTGQIEDFHDTACLVANLDLVITIDTAVAHVAGALGKPVWMLMPHSPDWRWQAGEQGNAWYPTARYFKQTPDRDWSAAFAEMSQAFAQLPGVRRN